MTLTFFVLAVAAVVLAVLTGWLAVRFMIRSRNQASYWRQRRRAGRRAYHLSLLAALFLGCSLVFCLASWVSTMTEGEEEETIVGVVPSATVIQPATATLFIPSATPVILIPVTFTPTATFTDTETATASPEPEVTSTPSETQIANTPTLVVEMVISPTATEIIPAATTAAPVILSTSTAQPITYAEIRLDSVSETISDDWQPVHPAATFTEGIQRLYFYFSYEDVSSRTVLQKTLLRDGQILMQHTDAWGVTAPEGETFFFFGQEEGFAPGNYEFRITQGERVLVSTLFTIEPAP